MSMAAILLTMAPLASADADSPDTRSKTPRRSIAVSATASVRILSPAVISFARQGKVDRLPSNQVQPQRRIERMADTQKSVVWIEFS